MSVDLWLAHTTCDHCGHTPRETGEINLTYNLGKMWARAVRGSQWPERRRTAELDGMTVEESVPLIEHVLAEVERNRDEFRALQPSNGWGTLAWFEEAMRIALEAAKESPKAVWKASR